MDVWRVLTKRRYTVLVATILLTALAVWHAYRTPAVYETASSIEIKPSSLNNSSMALQADEDTVALKTEVEVIQSDSVLFQTAQSIDLIRLVRQNEGKDAAQGSAPVTSQERGAMLGIMKQGLSITIVPNTRILTIRYRGTNPQLAADIVNGLVDTYSDEGLRISFERTAHVSDWLERQINNLKQDAADAQRQLADYQKAHNIVGTDQNSNLTVQTLEKISGELDEAEADRIMKEARMRDFNAMKPDMMALMSDDPTLATLYSQLTDLQESTRANGDQARPQAPCNAADRFSDQKGPSANQ